MGRRSSPVRTRPAATPFAATLTVALTLALTGCAGVTSRQVGSPSSTTSQADHRLSVPNPSTSTEPALLVEPVHWTPCSNDLQCGSVTVPVDYSNPDGPTIAIALARHPAEDPSLRIGSLVINPGGPGTSGIDDLPNELSILGSAILDRFDVVSFDPRGVERSAAISCNSPASDRTTVPSSTKISSSSAPLDPVPVTPAEQQALVDADRSEGVACEAASGALLAHMGTVDVARDLDRMRAALGDSQLTFVGHSYGTLIGATYATMFPTHVRAMILDGAIDPAISMTELVSEQAHGYEQSLLSFASWCSGSSSCSWRPGSDPTQAVESLITEIQSHPLPAGGGQVTGPSQVYQALLAGLESESNWDELGAALAAAAAGDGSPLTAMANRYETGGSSNGAAVEMAVDCLDHPVDSNPADYPALAQQAAISAPVFGPWLTWGLLICAEWPEPPTRTVAPASDPGAPPILVVGTEHDPVTSYQWSVDLAGELTGGRLLSWSGDSHVASFYSSCVRSDEAAYLLDGTLPSAGTVCPA